MGGGSPHRGSPVAPLGGCGGEARGEPVHVARAQREQHVAVLEQPVQQPLGVVASRESRPPAAPAPRRRRPPPRASPRRPGGPRRARAPGRRRARQHDVGERERAPEVSRQQAACASRDGAGRRPPRASRRECGPPRAWRAPRSGGGRSRRRRSRPRTSSPTCSKRRSVPGKVASAAAAAGSTPAAGTRSAPQRVQHVADWHLLVGGLLVVASIAVVNWQPKVGRRGRAGGLTDPTDRWQATCQVVPSRHGIDNPVRRQDNAATSA